MGKKMSVLTTVLVACIFVLSQNCAQPETFAESENRQVRASAALAEVLVDRDITEKSPVILQNKKRPKPAQAHKN